jgi:hypothetical protein
MLECRRALLLRAVHMLDETRWQVRSLWHSSRAPLEISWAPLFTNAASARRRAHLAPMIHLLRGTRAATQRNSHAIT